MYFFYYGGFKQTRASKIACNHALEIGLKSLKKVIYFYKKPIKKHILVINKTALA